MKFQFSPLSTAILDFSGKWKTVNISKTVKDRAISSESLIHRVVQESPLQRGGGGISIFATFGGYLGFLRKRKSVNISKTVTDRGISSDFFTHRVVQECPVQR